MKREAFPKEVYLEWETPQNDPPSLLAHTDPTGAAEVNSDVRIGVYRLVRVAKITTGAELVPSR
jgi:hypothetical protein